MPRRLLPAATPQSHPIHPIQIVTRRTGLSADVVRAWEKRYHVVTPVRSPNGRRLYSDTDITRLRLLAQATLTGRSIGQVAALPTAELAALVGEGDRAASLSSNGAHDDTTPSSTPAARDLMEESLDAIGRYDGIALDLLLRRATMALSADTFLDALVVPLVGRLGVQVGDGTLRPSHRHLAHAVLRRVLDHVVATATAPLDSHDLVVSTPSGQAQELGALVVAATAAAEGWRVTYVGPGVPAEDIVETAQHLGARAVALSLGVAPGDREVARELRRLRALLPPGVDILVDGAADAHRTVLGEIGAIVLGDRGTLRSRLRAQRGESVPLRRVR
jgi:hypothetical protein